MGDPPPRGGAEPRDCSWAPYPLGFHAPPPTPTLLPRLGSLSFVLLPHTQGDRERASEGKMLKRGSGIEDRRGA